MDPLLGFSSLGVASLVAALLVAVSILLHVCKRSPVYLVDYACVKYPDEHKTNLEVMLYLLQQHESIAPRDIVFQMKVLLKSGIGEEAYVPRANLERGRYLRLQDSHDQAYILVVGAVNELLKKTGVRGHEVDFLIVNSGMFNPTPSLTALLVNLFKMRTDVRTFNLGGMGCSAGLISVDLAKDLLGLYKNKYALIVSTEVLQALYDGKQRSMMVTNCIFRSAGNALLLSNKPRDRIRAKLRLLHCVRVNTAAQDEAHDVVVVKEDEEGVAGAQLGVKLIEVAGNAVKLNVQRLAPKVLPPGELLKAACNEVQRKWLKMNVKQYMPNFKLAFKHFCIHPGGKAVIEGIGKSFGLNKYDMEPSLMALHRFGNTSCAGVWYILAYCEAKERLNKGDKVWQIGLGSGFKCTTAVWEVMRNIREPVREFNSPWADCIHRYPVLVETTDVPHIRKNVQFIKAKVFRDFL